jgi:uncharacterized membrane protein
MKISLGLMAVGVVMLVGAIIAFSARAEPAAAVFMVLMVAFPAASVAVAAVFWFRAKRWRDEQRGAARAASGQ